ncbi:histidinol-phosphate transaminase [Thermodesulfobacteriota bacterium]
MKLSIPDNIKAIQPYKAGKPIEELQREYGIFDSIKIASNENPFGPSPLAARAIREAVLNLHRYPDSSGYELIEKIAEKQSVKPENVVLGNGSDDIIGMLTTALLSPGDEVIMPRPSFLMYEILTRSAGAEPVFVPLKKLSIDLETIGEKMTPRTRMVFLCNPNNPTGTVFSKRDFQNFQKIIPRDVVVVIDEAYIEFVRDPDCAQGIEYFESDRAIVTMRTFSKAYGLAGLRIGYGIMPEILSEILNRIRQPFNTSSLAQAGALAALDDEDFLTRTTRLIHAGLDFLYASLDTLGIPYFPTQANFFLIDVGQSADAVFENMLRQGVIVRSMTSYGYPEYIRINVGLEEENARFVDVLRKVLR